MTIDKYLIPKNKDRRIKFTDEDRERIKEFRKDGLSYNEIARQVGCSKRYTQFVCNPEKLLQQKKLFKERRKDGRYYYKDKWKDQMSEHRAYKNTLLTKGELTKK